jgi:transcriptional regulator with PAS, ATPase and Fis domain
MNLAAISYREVEGRRLAGEAVSGGAGVYGENGSRGGNGNGARHAHSLSPFPYIVTRNPVMLELLDTVVKIQPMAVTVLVHGETGTGKELIAQALHGQSSRPFVTINCAAMAEGVLESELFGHVRGAFTDAHRDKEGLFARAAGGTVFLDEIDKTSRNFQERLLGVVDKREYRPVGSNESRRADFRIVCATNRDLARDVEDGRFLKDLFYRLKVVYLRVPPLRERREDVGILAEHFLAEHSRRLGRECLELSPAAIELLAGYSWPGNVRDLEHEVERAVAFSPNGSVIGADLFSPEIRASAPRGLRITESGDLSRAVEELEVGMIREALLRYGGNRSRAARSLGLSRRGLLNKIQRYQLTGSRP